MGCLGKLFKGCLIFCSIIFLIFAIVIIILARGINGKLFGVSYTLNEDNASYTLSEYGCWNLKKSFSVPSAYKGKPVTKIGNEAFYFSELKEIRISDSVTTIGDHAFDGCESLASITIPNSVTTIGKSAFYACSDLTSLTIPDSVAEINWQAFRHCSGLTSITIGNSVATIDTDAFDGCSNLASVYYKGAEAEWNNIDIGDNNNELETATRYYYSESEPTSEGNYWHYDAEGKVVIWE